MVVFLCIGTSNRAAQTETDHIKVGAILIILVDHLENKWHQIIEELHRWRGILASEWNLYKSGRGVLFSSDTTSPYTAPRTGLDV